MTLTGQDDAGRRSPLILGLDPGSRVAGYALVRVESGEPSKVEIGAWTLPSGRPREQRLARLAERLEELVEARAPDAAAVEGLFHHRNVRSALALAESRGALLAALGRRRIPTFEYPPATVKQAICGRGNASKESVRRALVLTLPALRDELLAAEHADATDALAVALCHLVHDRFSGRVRGASV